MAESRRRGAPRLVPMSRGQCVPPESGVDYAHVLDLPPDGMARGLIGVAGAMLGYRISDRASLVGDLGVDQYFNGAITNGTDAGTYQTGEAGYNDVRARFAFPGTVFKAKVGVKFNF